MNIKQVTVFGGSGFIGRSIVRALAPQGYLIRVACRRIELAEPLKTAGDVGQITLMRANLRMPDSGAVAVKGSDAVINAAEVRQQVHRPGAELHAHETVMQHDGDHGRGM